MTLRGLEWLFKDTDRSIELKTFVNLETPLALLSESSVPPALVLLDLELPGFEGLQAFDHLRERFPNLPIAVISGHDEPELIFEVLRCQAVGYIPKATAPRQIVDAVLLILDGGTYIPPDVLRLGNVRIEQRQEVQVDSCRKLMELIASMPLRRKEVLSLLARGASNKEICRQLGISLNTVKTHVAIIFSVLEVNSRQSVALVIHRNQLIREFLLRED